MYSSMLDLLDLCVFIFLICRIGGVDFLRGLRGLSVEDCQRGHNHFWGEAHEKQFPVNSLGKLLSSDFTKKKNTSHVFPFHNSNLNILQIHGGNFIHDDIKRNSEIHDSLV